MRFGSELCHAPVPTRFAVNRQNGLSQTGITQRCSQSRAIAATLFHPSSYKHCSNHIGKPGEDACIAHASGAYFTLHRVKCMHESWPASPVGIGTHNFRHHIRQPLHASQINFHTAKKQNGAWRFLGARAGINPTHFLIQGCRFNIIDIQHVSGCCRQKLVLFAVGKKYGLPG